jgi:hypothetical protein
MIVAAKVALVCAGTVVAGTTVLCSEGFLRVNVTERGRDPHHINVMAPAMLVPIAVHFASHFGSRQQIGDATEKIQPWVPTIRAALDELDNLDDMTLVEVNEPGDHARIEKVDSSMVIEVDDPDATVHVSAPILALSSSMRQIADAADTASSAHWPNH